MSLPPLANLLAVATPDPAELREVREAVEADGSFDPPCSPAPGWLVATTRLPGSAPDGEDVRAAGLAFAQGREEVAASGRPWVDVARLVAERPQELDELPGDFGLLHVGPDGKATVVRSAGGLVPFYVTGGDGRWTVATTLALLLRFHRGQLELDPLVNAIWTSGADAAPDVEGPRPRRRGRARIDRRQGAGRPGRRGGEGQGRASRRRSARSSVRS